MRLLEIKIEESCMIVNKNRTNSSNLRQWHPAFFADIQIELESERENLIFENEHQLGTKPMEIDALVIKKKTDIPINKNIGRIFRKYNIIEYKSPTDYISINDFYKVCGDAFFYKADTVTEDEIPIEEITISLVSRAYPRKMLRHLREFWKCRIKKIEEGIYYVTGSKIPIQVIVTEQLSKKKNLWLRSLTDRIKDKEDMKRLLNEYREKQKNPLYESVMQMIVRANEEKFREADCMCEALNRIIQDQIEEKIRKSLQAGYDEGYGIGMQDGIKDGMQQGMQQGIQQGMQQGEHSINSLILCLAELGRTSDIIKSASDPEYQKKLLKEFGLLLE